MRPRIAAGLLAELLAAAPARVRKRLDADPGVADRWAWAEDGGVWTVTAGGETVRLTAPDGALTATPQVACSCLLSPRCLHLLATVSALDLIDPAETAVGSAADARAGEGDPVATGAAGAGAMGADAAQGGAVGGGAEGAGVARGDPAPAAPDAPVGEGREPPAQEAPVREVPGPESPGPELPGRREPPGREPAVQLDAGQRAAAALAWGAGARLLAVGAGAAGAVVRGELLRAAHACQAAKLPRLGSAAVRVATGAQALTARRPEFELGRFAADLAELLTVAWRLGAGPSGRRPPPTPDDVGHGRRRYEPVGALQLHGLLSEAVIAGSGHAGVLTYLMDARGRLWAVPDVAPGGPERAVAAYRTAVRFGQLSLQHRELSRGRILAQGASGSADGRLGSGQGTAAVRGGPSSWDEPPIAARFAEPLEDQLDRVWHGDRTPPTTGPAAAADPAAGWAASPPADPVGGPATGPPTEGTRGCPPRQPPRRTVGRREGDDLVFIDAVLDGATTGGLVLTVRNARAPLTILGVPPSSSDRLEYLPNLDRLARLGGANLRLVGRVQPDRPRAVALLAAGPPAGPGPGPLLLPKAWEGRVNLGLDHLAGGHLAADAASTAAGRRSPAGPPAGKPSPARLAAPAPGGLAVPVPAGQPGHTEALAALDGLRRAVLRAAVGGRATLGGAATTTLVAEIGRLRRAHLPTAAELLDRLAAAGVETRRSLTGERRPPPPDRLARVWASAMTYLAAADHAMHRAAWTSSLPWH